MPPQCHAHRMIAEVQYFAFHSTVEYPYMLAQYRSRTGVAVSISALVRMLAVNTRIAQSRMRHASFKLAIRMILRTISSVVTAMRVCHSLPLSPASQILQ